ncbi:MAG: hypothetical protein IJ916_12865 [Paludibacteraceae bacterium]|nr:hypothetical protein [Paludibacteraceae bacterium]
METWNEFCYKLIDCKKKNASEEHYHLTIENQLSALGWKSYKGEICHKEHIPSGHGYAEPDILIKKEGVNQMVIEVKKPNHIQTSEERLQLLSYMRLCTLRVGIYIGEHIEIFYDQINSEEPVSVYRVPLELNDERGQQFMELIKRDNFDKNNFQQFCLLQLQEKKKLDILKSLKDDLLNGKYNTFLKDCLKNRIFKDGNSLFSESQIDDLLSTLQIKIFSEGVDTCFDNCFDNSEYIESDPSLSDGSKHKRDNTRYSLDGGKFLPKRKFVLQVVKKYTQLSNMTFAELLKDIPDEWQGSLGVIKKINEIGDPKRYFDEILYSADKLQFAVCNQWGKDNIQNIVKFAKKQGWRVETKS